jgi:hypothetical protein
VTVTGPGGVLSESYTIRVTRVSLSTLSVDQGSLTFAADTFEYDVAVAYNIDTITITPTVLTDSLTVTVNDLTPPTPIVLAPGATTEIDVTVTGPGGVLSESYTIRVTRVSLSHLQLPRSNMALPWLMMLETSS